MTTPANNDATIHAIAEKCAHNIAVSESMGWRHNVNLYHRNLRDIVTAQIKEAINEATAELQKERDELLLDKAMLDWVEENIDADVYYDGRGFYVGPFGPHKTLRQAIAAAMRKEGV